MANRTAWTAGNGASLTWTAAFTGTDLNSPGVTARRS